VAFVNRIKELRLAKKLNQSQLAQIIGIAQPTLSGWETGRTQIDYDNLIKLANFFETSIDHLLGQTPNLSTQVLPQQLDANTSYIDKALGEMNAQVARLSGKILSSGDKKKIEQTLTLLEKVSTMDCEQIEALNTLLKNIK
jgi:transcriptional regulator with XRE-family HTH domain